MFVHDGLGVNRSGVTASSRDLHVSDTRTSLPLRLARHPLIRELAALLVVLVASALVLQAPAVEQAFSVDESRWIATSRYFWITFLDHDLFGPEWRPNYLVYTHPPVARYIIGFGLWLQGWSPDDLNGRYDSLGSRLYNLREGNIPSPELLLAARRVTSIFAVASVVLIYAIARQVGGRLAGLAAAALTLVNPLLTTVWTRALAESIVSAFGLLALALAIWVMPHVASIGRRAWVPLAVGAALALSAASKLSGGIEALGLGMFAAIQQTLALLEHRRTRGFRAWVDAAMVAIVLFVAVNPLLYLNPVERAVNLIRHRQDEMEIQRSIFTSQAVPENLPARIQRVWQRTFEDYATPGGPLPLSPDVLLVAVGTAVLIAGSVAELRRHAPGPALLVLCWLGLTYVVVTPNLGFDSSHYFAPLVNLNVIVSGIAVASMLRALWRLGHAWLVARARQDQNVQVPVR